MRFKEGITVGMDPKPTRRVNLTISMRADIIEDAKRQAEAEHLSLSRLIEKLLAQHLADAKPER